MEVQRGGPGRVTVMPAEAAASDTSGGALNDEEARDFGADVAAPALTHWGTFASRSVEREFLESDLSERFARATALACTLSVIALSPIFLVQMINFYVPLVTLVLRSLLTVLTMVVAVAALVAVRLRRVPLRFLEVSTALIIVIYSIQAITAGPDRLVAIQTGAFPPCGEYIDSPGSIALKSTFALLVPAVFVPMNPKLFLVVTVIVAAQLAITEVLLPIPGFRTPWGPMATALVLLPLTAVRRARVEREQWHFRREIEARARAWRALRAAEMEAKVRVVKAEASTTARSRLIRVTMHDLRSPLLAVRNIADVMADPAPGADKKFGPEKDRDGEASAEPEMETDTGTAQGQEQARLVRELQSCTKLMEGIVSDLLDFERIESGRMVLVPHPFTLTELFAEAHLAYGQLARAKRVALEFAPLPSDLASRDVAFVGDRRRLLQCLGNGLSNAIKFSEPHQRVTVSAALVGPITEAEAPVSAAVGGHTVGLWRVRVVVADEGVGMTAEELDVLQKGEPFSQVGRGQLQGKGGTGLGLTIVRAMLDTHNGSALRLRSEGHNRGTEFEMDLCLPRALSQQGAGTSEQRHSAKDGDAQFRSQGGPMTHNLSSTSGGAALHKPGDRSAQSGTSSGRREAEVHVRVLHVEDDKILRHSLQVRLFARHPLVVREVAEDGARAVELVRARAAAGDSPYDLVVMDNQMPNVGGTEATRLLRKLGFKGTIIGMTGDPAGSPDRSEFEMSGLNDCVDKTPEGVAAVAKCLDALLAARTAETAAPAD